jgi:predicted GNAT family acetyltransferase
MGSAPVATKGEPVAEPGTVTVRQNLEEQCYEAIVDGRLAGFVTYLEKPGGIVFVHTEVDSAFEGQGVGSRLAAGALDDARTWGLSVVAQCPFIGEYIRRHPDYQALIAAGDDAR